MSKELKAFEAALTAKKANTLPRTQDVILLVKRLESELVAFQKYSVSDEEGESLHPQSSASLALKLAYELSQEIQKAIVKITVARL